MCFLANLTPYCSPLAARVVVDACLRGAWHLSADPESCVGEVGRRRSGVGMPIVCVYVVCVWCVCVVCVCVVCVCVLCISVPEAPWERPHAPLWALLPLSAGAWVLAAFCPITW